MGQRALISKAGDPPTRALEWVCDVLGGRQRVVEVASLAGGMSSAVHRVRLRTTGGAETDVVLKRFVDADWLAVEPDLADREVAALDAAKAVGVSAPRALACDSSADRCDVPALVMTFVPGAPELPLHPDTAWIDQLASPLPVLHYAGESAAAGLPAYRAYNATKNLTPPAWSTDPRAWQRSYEILERTPSSPRSLIHRDYHPCNLLWSDHEIVAITDWTMACSGPVAIDTAHCRLNLVCLYGVDVADAFSSAYREHGGMRQDPFWDLRCVVDTLPLDVVYPGWVDLGRRDLRLDEIRMRIDGWVSKLSAELRGG